MSKDLSAQLAELQGENETLKRKLARIQSSVDRNKASAAFTRSISLMHQKEQYLQEQYMNFLLAKTPNMLILMDKQDNVAYCSNSTLITANIPYFADIKGKHYREILLKLIDKAAVENLECEINCSRNNGQQFDTEISLQSKKDGTGIYRLCFVAGNGKSEFECSILIIINITEIKSMQKEAESARQKALEISSAKSMFLSNMSHEIRTPMNAIIGMTAIAQSADDCIRKDYCLGKIKDAATLLLGIINDILDLSKIEANKLEIVNQEFEVRHFLQRILDVINFRLEEKEQKFSVCVDKLIPAVIDADEQRLSQVLINLLSNAVKFTPEQGSISLDIKLLNEENEECLIQFNVTDTGIGLTEEQQERLFRSFEQAESSTSKKFGGTGLGLAISKRIVEMMGGTVWITSQFGHGSSFGFTIRCKRKSFINTLMNNSGQDTEDKHKPIFDGKTILVAEDVKVNREIVKALLAVTKIDIDFAVNGRDAISMFSAAPSKYSMIFMDMQMPEVDGIEATAAIRKLNIPEAKTIPVIAMTANVFKEDIDKCIAAGMNDHIGKPLDITLVIEKMKKYI